MDLKLLTLQNYHKQLIEQIDAWKRDEQELQSLPNSNETVQLMDALKEAITNSTTLKNRISQLIQKEESNWTQQDMRFINGLGIFETKNKFDWRNETKDSPKRSGWDEGSGMSIHDAVRDLDTIGSDRLSQRQGSPRNQTLQTGSPQNQSDLRHSPRNNVFGERLSPRESSQSGFDQHAPRFHNVSSNRLSPRSGSPNRLSPRSASPNRLSPRNHTSPMNSMDSDLSESLKALEKSIQSSPHRYTVEKSIQLTPTRNHFRNISTGQQTSPSFARDQLAELEKELLTRKSQEEKLSEYLDQAKSEAISHKEKVKHFQTKEIHLQQQLQQNENEFTERIDEKDSELQRMKDEVMRLKQRILEFENAPDQINHWKDLLKEMETNANMIQSQFKNTLSFERNRLLEDLTRTKNDLNKLQRADDDKDQQIQKLHDQISTQETTIDKLTEEVKAGRYEIQFLRDQIDPLAEELDHLRNTKKDSEALAVSLNRKIQSMQLTIDSLQKGQNEGMNYNVNQSCLHLLEKGIEHENHSLRSVIEQLREENLRLKNFYANELKKLHKIVDVSSAPLKLISNQKEKESYAQRTLMALDHFNKSVPQYETEDPDDPLDKKIAQMLQSINTGPVKIQIQKIAPGEYFIDRELQVRLLNGEVVVRINSSYFPLRDYLLELYSPFLQRGGNQAHEENHTFEKFVQKSDQSKRKKAHDITKDIPKNRRSPIPIRPPQPPRNPSSNRIQTPKKSRRSPNRRANTKSPLARPGTSLHNRHTQSSQQKSIAKARPTKKKLTKVLESVRKPKKQITPSRNMTEQELRLLKKQALRRQIEEMRHK